MSSAPTTVHVPLGERAYDILIGPKLIEAAGARDRRAPARRARRRSSPTRRSPRLHLPRLRLSLAAQRHRLLRGRAAAPARRRNPWRISQTVAEGVIAARLERGDVVVALGGGVIGDLAGFAAAIVRRGMDFVQIPTTLLAQVDSSVGGKTGINSPQGKNLVGAFHQPRLVLADTAVLDTLPPREFAAGYAEVVKYGLIDRPDFFAWLETTGADDLRRRPRPHRGDRARAAEAKAEVVVADEREDGAPRAAQPRPHLRPRAGSGLPLRCRRASSTARRSRSAWCSRTASPCARASRRARMPAASRRIWPAPACRRASREIPGAGFSVDELMGKIAQDKKVSRGTLTFILTRGIGEAFIARDVDPADVAAFLADEIRR